MGASILGLATLLDLVRMGGFTKIFQLEETVPWLISTYIGNEDCEMN